MAGDDIEVRGGSRGTVLAVGVAALAILVLVAIVLQRGPPELDPDTPQGVVQAWLTSIAEQDPDLDLVDVDDCADPIDLRDLRQPFRAVVVATQVEESVATVDLRITEFAGAGPFDDGFTFDARYDLERGDDGWVITAFDWPWTRCVPLQDGP